MAQDISAFGLTIALTADKTFPTVPLAITQFADDADPLDFPAIQIADSAMGVNGDFIRWAKAQKYPMTITVIPGSLDDVNLGILADNNRAAQGKTVAGDVIAAVVTYPDGTVVSLSDGVMETAVLGKAVSSQGRMKTKTYAFAFGKKN